MQTQGQREAVKKFRSSQKFKDWQKDYRKNRKKTDLEYHERLKARKRESHKRNIVHNLWKRTKKRAGIKGLEFSLKEEDIVIPIICPLLEIPIFVGTKKDYQNSPTIDRLDNSKGYTPDNCRVVSMLANSMKNSATKEQLQTFYSNIFNYLNLQLCNQKT